MAGENGGYYDFEYDRISIQYPYEESYQQSQHLQSKEQELLAQDERFSSLFDKDFINQIRDFTYKIPQNMTPMIEDKVDFGRRRRRRTLKRRKTLKRNKRK